MSDQHKHMEDSYANEQNANAPDTNVQHTNAQHTNAQNANAQHTNAQNANAQHTNAQHTNAQHTSVQHTDGPGGMMQKIQEQRLHEIHIQIPEGAAVTIRRLEQAGYEAFIVGGCVRDACLGRRANDWDITTNASPEQVKALFRRTVDTGIQHGTVTVMQGDAGFEVTTYRIDGAYEDSRHPKEVTFTSSLREDLRRRDFTINAMAYSDRTGLVDEFGGLMDLKEGLIRCVGNAEERFTEDALRIMRAVRFAAQLDFAIDPDTAAAARKLAPNLQHISAERIREELQKTILSRHPERLKTAYELGITAVVLPEFDAAMKTSLYISGNISSAGSMTVGEHTLHAMQASAPEPVLRWTMLLHDLGKPVCPPLEQDGRRKFPGHPQTGADMADGILNRLKSDRATQRLVHVLIAAHGDKPAAKAPAVRRMASALGRETFALYLEVKRADILAHSPERQPEQLAWLDAVCGVWADICSSRDPLTLGELAVTGQDLIAAGMKPGKQMGGVLHQLLDAVLENPACNTKEILMQLANREQ